MTQQKAIIFDASSLISLSMNGLFDEIRKLKEKFGGKFLITKEVKSEVIDKPINIKKFELEALRIKQLLDEKILELPISFDVKDSEISEQTSEFLRISNSLFNSKGREIHIIDLGEASCLVLSRILDKKNIKNVVAVDERTMRMLVEKPENLEKLMSDKLHTKIIPKKENYKFFKGFKIIRSAELVYVAYKHGLVNLKNGIVLDALLYAVKFKGCAISSDEIDEIKRIK